MICSIATIFICFIIVTLDGVVLDVRRHPNWRLLEHVECGISLADRIIGGSNATLGQYPWLARIGYVDDSDSEVDSEVDITFKCAGSLINRIYVLTAAHCVDNESDDSYIAIIRLGEHNALTEIDCEEGICAEPVQDFRPTQLIVHKHYDQPAYKNDIALIRLNRPAIYNDWVQPICIPFGDQLVKSYEGVTAEVAGWGLYNLSSPLLSDYLRFVRMPILGNEICRYYLQSYADIGPTQICAGGVIGKDSCGGDSGAPMVKPEANHGFPRYYIIGIVSFGAEECGDSDMPGVYTRLASYVPWILNNISK
ncbi:hypothetical protein RI129_002547 [Pyrocoelia pectoralis]|uniref:Peptidase S1 domain-containing protein n=1 Tax=Pyrocoelia pectoralis TaxID=417401 RepID=A0AAN7VG83_9COLE